MRTRSANPSARLLRVAILSAAALATMAATCGADFHPPLYIGNVQPVLDEYGRPLAGAPAAAAAASRARVEIRTTTDGIRRPPTKAGQPHPFNPLLFSEGVVGKGHNAATAYSGIFCLVLPQPPAAGTKIFARAFNASTVEAASFYADSDVVEVVAGQPTLVLNFGPIAELDTDDDDGDGLSNSWEKSLGTDPGNPDTDGNGMTDYQEWLAGTDPLDPNSLLEFVRIRPDGRVVAVGANGGDVARIRVGWQSVPGKTYRLEHVAALPPVVGVPLEFELIEEITAGEDERQIEMLVDLEEGRSGFFRVRLVVP